MDARLLASAIGFLAFSVSPIVILSCAVLLLTRGFAGLVRPRRFAVLSVAALCAALSWVAAATVKWGAPLLAKALVSKLKLGSRLVPYSAGAEFAVLVAPFFCAVALGSYALLTVGAKLYRFNDCEDASQELTEVRGGACVCALALTQPPSADLQGASPVLPALAPYSPPPSHFPPPPLPSQHVAEVKKALRRKGFKRAWSH